MNDVDIWSVAEMCAHLAEKQVPPSEWRCITVRQFILTYGAERDEHGRLVHKRGIMEYRYDSEGLFGLWRTQRRMRDDHARRKSNG